MDCNRKCYWNYDGQCCPEDEKGVDKALPNNENCSTYLRPDFEDELRNTLEECKILLNFRNYKHLCEIRHFIQNQKETDTLYQIEDCIKNTKRLKGFYLEAIIKKFDISELTALDIINYFVNKNLLKIKREIRCPNCSDIIGYQRDRIIEDKLFKDDLCCECCGQKITAIDYLTSIRDYYEVVR